MEIMEHGVIETFEFDTNWNCVFVAELIEHFLLIYLQ